MQASQHQITEIATPEMKLPEAAASPGTRLAAQWPFVPSAPAINWSALSPVWLLSWLRQPSFNLPALEWSPLKWPRKAVAAFAPRQVVPAPTLAVLDKFASYRLPALATKTMLPLVLAIGVLLLSMVRVEFLPGEGTSLNDINGSTFAPVAASELGACQAQSWPNFSPECIKSPTQLAAARRVDVR